MQNWKIKNISQEPIKISIAAGNNRTPGIILQVGQFCISEGRMTSPIDAQVRRGYIKIDETFDNSKLKLTLGKAFDESELDKAVAAVKEYTK